MTALPPAPDPAALEDGTTVDAEELEKQDEIREFDNLRAEVKKGSTGYEQTLERRADRELPQRGHLNRFEDLSFRERQILLMRLHKLQSTVNLKPLPIAMGLFSGALGALALLIRSMTGYEWLAGILLLVVFIILAITGVIMLRMIPAFTKADAHLTAWTEAFKDSHARKTKIEEEQRKSAAPIDAASTAGGDVPTADTQKSEPVHSKSHA